VITPESPKQRENPNQIAKLRICCKNSLATHGIVASASSSLLWNVAKIFLQQIHSKDRFHVDNLVKTALKYSGGLKELIHTIKRFESTESSAWQKLEIALAKLPLQ
jgi:hypothetical protein